jgi:hypothetical protein
LHGHIENEGEGEQIIDILHTFSFFFSPSANEYIHSIGVKKKEKKWHKMIGSLNLVYKKKTDQFEYEK